MNLKKTALQTAMAAVIGVSASAAQAAAVNAGDVLTITAGTPAFDYYGVQTNVTAGSYFGMDNDGNSKITGGEKVVLAQGTTGLTIGTTTAPGASHAGAPTAGDSGDVTAPWGFFGNTGTDYLTSPVSGDTTNGLDMSGWTVTWAGIPAIPMGAGSWTVGNCGILGCDNAAMGEGTAEFNWSGTYGDSYTLNYAGTVPQGDPSGFGGVQYFLHLEGTVEQASVVPVPAAVWLFGSGLLGLVGVARRRA